VSQVVSSSALPDATPSAGPDFRPAPAQVRDGNAAMVAAAICVLGSLVFLVAQFGWWALLAGPVYLCGVMAALMVARGRVQALVAVIVATASMGILVGLLRLAGLG
jgi:hypothetical protein